MNNRVVVNANNGYGSAISRENKYPAITAKLLDYAYGKEGNLLFNYGVEGDTYTLVDGEPQFTDKVMKPGDGKTPGDIVTKYCFAASDQAMVLNPDTRRQADHPGDSGCGHGALEGKLLYRTFASHHVLYAGRKPENVFHHV